MITIPTLQELYDSILNDIQSAYGTNIPTFGKNFLRVMAGVQAAKLKIMYWALANVQKNVFVDTAEPESAGGTLERFGRIKLGRNPFPATAGEYVIQVTGTIGSTIPISQTWKSDDDSANPGMLFILDAAYTLVSATDTVTVRALALGTGSQMEVDDTMTATSPIAGVDAQATVVSEETEPLDAEGIEEYRNKAIAAYRLEPQGGAATDYRLWALDAQGVKQAYPYAKSGYSNEINLFIEANIADSTDGKGTPSATILTAVEEMVEFDPDQTKPQSERGRRPLGVLEVHYLPITPRTVDIEIPDYVNLTTELETQITDALEEMVNAIRPYVASCDVAEDKNDILDTNKIVSAILNVKAGASFGSVVLRIDGVSLSTFTFSNGDIPYFNSVSFT